MKKLRKRDYLLAAEYDIVDELALHDKWGHKETGVYVAKERVRDWIAKPLQEYYDKARDELVKRGYVNEYKGGKLMALNSASAAQIQRDRERYRARFERLLRKLGHPHS